MAKKIKFNENNINKENFIEFLSQMSPQEINELISNRGKPIKLIEPIYTFRNDNSKEQNPTDNHIK